MIETNFQTFISFSLFRSEHKVNLRKFRQRPEQSEEAEGRQTGNTISSPEKCQVLNSVFKYTLHNTHFTLQQSNVTVGHTE